MARDARPHRARRAAPPATRSTWSAPSPLGSRLGGHIVQGHVDGVGDGRRARARRALGGRHDLAARRPRPLRRREGLDHRRRRLPHRRRRSATTTFTVSLIPTTLALHHARRQAAPATRSTSRSTSSPSTSSGCSAPSSTPTRRAPRPTGARVNVLQLALRRPGDHRRPRRSPGGRSSATRFGLRLAPSAACAAGSGPGRSASSATSCCSPSSSSARSARRGAAPLFGQAGRQVFFIVGQRLRLVALAAATAAGGAGDRPRSRRAGPPARRAARRCSRPAAVGTVAASPCCSRSAPAPVELVLLADAWIFVGSHRSRPTRWPAAGSTSGWPGSPSTWSACPLLLHGELYPSAVLYVVYGALRASGASSPGGCAPRRDRAADRPLGARHDGDHETR